MKYAKLIMVSIAVMALLAFQANIWAACKTDKPALNVPSTKEVKARPGVVYLAINGATPKADDCGLKAKNDAAQWTGWGGPLDSDNMSIGEGPKTRNLITISGVRYERGVGTHAAATFVFDLTGGNYASFSAVAGLDDEKDGPIAGGKYTAPQCGHGGSSEFVFSVDGKEVKKTAVLKGVVDGNNGPAEEVKFDIPSGSKELTIRMTEGGDGGGCDHADLGDAMLIPRGGGVGVEAKGKLAASWGEMKSRK